MNTSPTTVAIRDLVPLLFVNDIQRSLAFYRDKLGFWLAEKWDRSGELAWCRLVRDGFTVMLQQACAEDGPADGRGRGVGLFFLCNDANALHGELTAKGLALAPPSVAFYGMNQLFLKDPDGYELCFQNTTDQRSRVRDAWCSFCRKNYREVGPLAEGPDRVYICVACCRLCADIIDQESKRRGPAA